MAKGKKIQVSFTREQWRIIKKFEGFGGSDAEIIRNIVLAWLAEKSIITKSTKKKLKG